MICDVERKTAQTSVERQWGYREDFDSRRLSHRNFKQEPHLLKVQEFPFLPALKAQEKVSERNLTYQPPATTRKTEAFQIS